MRIKKEMLAVALIFFVIFTLRLYFTLQTPEFSTDDSYWVLKQIEQISESGYPQYYDAYAYEGRTYIFAPLYHYIMAFFNLIFNNVFLLKLVHNIMISLVIIPVFLISRQITKDIRASIFASFIAAFIPVLFSKTINSLDSSGLFITLLMFVVYFFLNIESDKTTKSYTGFMVFLVLAALTDYSVLILVPILVLHIVINRIDDKSIKRAEYELIIFTVSLLLWLAVISIKRSAILKDLVGIASRMSLLAQSPGVLQIVDSLVLVGFIPLICGFYIAYRFVFKSSSKAQNLMLSFLITVITATSLKLINFNEGLMLVGLILSIFFSVFFKQFFMYVNKTRFASYRNLFTISLYVLFLITGAIPSIAYAVNEIQAAPDNALIRSLQELKYASDSEAVFVSSPMQASLIEYYAEINALLDEKLVFASNSGQLISQVDSLYGTQFTLESLRIVNKYSIDYIIITNSTQQFFNVSEAKFITDQCYAPIKMPVPGIRVYTPKCEVRGYD